VEGVGKIKSAPAFPFVPFQRFFAVKAATPGRHVARRDRPGRTQATGEKEPAPSR